ncbi:MAG: hypothetical protein ACI8U4_001275 [Natronomonas sp.]|jgi:hypothetical protein
MERFVGLVVFTLGLALFVFPMPVLSAASDWGFPTPGHRTKVVVRVVGLLGMVVGFRLVVA